MRSSILTEIGDSAPYSIDKLDVMRAYKWLDALDVYNNYEIDVPYRSFGKLEAIAQFYNAEGTRYVVKFQSMNRKPRLVKAGFSAPEYTERTGNANPMTDEHDALRIVSTVIHIAKALTRERTQGSTSALLSDVISGFAFVGANKDGRTSDLDSARSRIYRYIIKSQFPQVKLGVISMLTGDAILAYPWGERPADKILPGEMPSLLRNADHAHELPAAVQQLIDESASLRRVIRERIMRMFDTSGDTISVQFNRPDAPMFADAPVFEISFREKGGTVDDMRGQGDAFTTVRKVWNAAESVLDRYPDTQAFYMSGADDKRKRVFPEMLRRIVPDGWVVERGDLGITWIKRIGYVTPDKRDPFSI